MKLSIVLLILGLFNVQFFPFGSQTSFTPDEQIAQAQLRSIYIPKLRLSLPIQTSEIVNGQWQIDTRKTAFYGRGSSLPGNPGTTVIFAHAKDGLFDYLPLLSKDDTITISSNIAVFVYAITNRRLVNPKDLTFLQTEGENVLAIFTCFGQNETKRLVYFGKLIKTAPLPKINNTLYQI